MNGWKQGDMFLAGKKKRVYFDLISDVGIRRILFVSGSWCCQIQTTRLIMFFIRKREFFCKVSSQNFGDGCESNTSSRGCKQD